MVTVGLDRLLFAPPMYLSGCRLGLLTNQASVGANLIHNRLLLQRQYGSNLTTLFSPQHGFYSEKQDNMIESSDGIDPVTGLPIFSLYGTVRKPAPTMLDNVDILLIDLQDVGTRVYTFIYTMAYCLEAAAKKGRKVVILDRPNPIGGISVEGNVLQSDCTSFVGLYPIPMRHGMTMGELAMMFNQEFAIGCDLQVVAMEKWKRSMYFRDTELPWIFPSPNMPTPETAMVYPGQVIWEGTTLSEGRGTTMPFELMGAPYIDPFALLPALEVSLLPGCRLRPLYFEPTSGKWAGQTCGGFQIHIIDRHTFKPYRTSLMLLQSIINLYPENFSYSSPPYEYEHERLPMDLILGSSKIRKEIEQGKDILELEKDWSEELDDFRASREKYLLYGD